MRALTCAFDAMPSAELVGAGASSRGSADVGRRICAFGWATEFDRPELAAADYAHADQRNEPDGQPSTVVGVPTSEPPIMRGLTLSPDP